MRNTTPAGIARRSSLIVAGVILTSLILIKFILPTWISWILVIAVPMVSALVAYIVFYWALERFLYRKIKLIYKTIYDSKSPVVENTRQVNMNSDVISNAEQEVIEWQRKETREGIKKKKLEKFRKEFLSNVFHELKTPIFNIQGYIETLADGGINDPNINVKFMEKARKNVKRMTEIVDDLQMISNLEDGSFSLLESKFDIHRLAIDAIDSHDIRAAKKGITIDFKEGCDRSFFVVGDRELIYQVLTNLITNSIKYGVDKGNTKIGLYEMGEQVLVEVADNGIGISQKHLTRIFERFYRVDKGRSRETGGSGLGLSIVKHIIEAHQQTLNVRSTKGVGTTIGFTLKKA